MKNLVLVCFAVSTLACGLEAPAGAGPQQAELPPQQVLATEDAGTPQASDAGTTDAGPVAVSYAYPAWQREDVQPQSARSGQTYGLETFRGAALVVVLLEGYCTFCRSNVVVAEQLRQSLRAEGRDVEVVVLSDANATDFVSRTSLILFRDGTAGRQAWQAMRPGAGKHDTFVFSASGERTFFWQGSYTGDATRWTAEVGAAVRAIAPVE